MGVRAVGRSLAENEKVLISSSIREARTVFFSVNGRRIQPQLNINCVCLACCVVARTSTKTPRNERENDNDDENQAGEGDEG